MTSLRGGGGGGGGEVSFEAIDPQPPAPAYTPMMLHVHTYRVFVGLYASGPVEATHRYRFKTLDQ